jgi:hypothetical protein
VATLLVPREDLEQPIHLRAGHVAQVLELHQPQRLDGVAEVGHRDPGVVQDGDAALVPAVQKLGPRDLPWLLLDDVTVVAHRVHVEVGRRSDDRPRLRFAVEGLVGPGIPPLDDRPVGARPFFREREARPAVRVEVHDTERRIALTGRALLTARLHLPLREDRVEALPRLDPGPVDGLEVAGRPDLEELVVVAAEQVEAAG